MIDERAGRGEYVRVHAATRAAEIPVGEPRTVRDAGTVYFDPRPLPRSLMNHLWPEPVPAGVEMLKGAQGRRWAKQARNAGRALGPAERQVLGRR